jgi:hypothetical protein
VIRGGASYDLWHATARLPNRAVAAVFVVGLAGWSWGAAFSAQPGSVIAPGCAITSTHVIPMIEIGGRTTASSAAVRLGGISDLAPAGHGSVHAAETARLWVLTDRGPNGTIKTAAGKRRTLLDPGFTPAIVAIEVTVGSTGAPAAGNGSEEVAAARILKVVQLTGCSGRPLSGRPNGIGNDEPILDGTSANELAPDPNGVDTEGLIRLRDGTFWVAEEYRPSLLHVSAEGRTLARYVPRGHALSGADMDVHDVLPSEYGSRRDNRGFEALAISPDETRLWAIVQSPLDNPVPKSGNATGNVRLLALDTQSKAPAAEYLYRLGDPAAPGYLSRGAPPNDGKLCAMAAIDQHTLLVLEQSEEGVARVYRCLLDGATDTLPRSMRPLDAGPALEQVGDLPAEGIVPVGKRLVADLAPLLPTLLRDVHGNPDAQVALKIEGMAILDREHVAFVNDNDFGVGATNGEAAPRNCLWIMQVEPLW